MTEKEIRLHPKQFEVWEDPHRFRVVCAGRRWGKSILAVVAALTQIGEGRDKIGAIVAPTYQQAKDIYWRDPQKLFSLIPPEAILKRNDSELFVQLINGSFLYFRGSDRPDTLRGLRYDFVVLDEYASMKENVWEEIIMPALLDSGGKALFISTPKGYDKFYTLWKKGQDSDPQWKSWQFSSYDNPHLDKQFIEQSKKDMDEDTFGQEILAEFKKYSGLVYKSFLREKHVIDPIELKDSWTFYRSIDFGWVVPTGVVFATISDKGVIYVFDEIYQAGLQTPDLALITKQKSGGRGFINSFADSAQAADIEELRRYGLAITPVNKTSGSSEDWTTFRIRKVNEKLQNGKLFIFKNCQNLVWEFENYKYHEVKEGQEVRERPAKINDHLLDALSYLVVSLPERIEPQIEGEVRVDFPEEHLFDKGGFY
jgi:PBSX family phage terminase large subunit